MCHLSHRLKIYLFRMKIIFRIFVFSRFCIFDNPMIYQICDVMVSISIWDRVHFWIYLLNHNLLSHQTRPINRSKKRQYFSGFFWTIGRTGARFQVLFNLAICSNYLITNYATMPVFWFFEKLYKGQLKMVHVNY